MKFIKLTNSSGGTYYLNSDKILTIFPKKSGSSIHIASREVKVEVEESAEQVLEQLEDCPCKECKCKDLPPIPDFKKLQEELVKDK